MDNEVSKVASAPTLVRLEEFSRRLYEEEINRSHHLNGSAKNLFLILAATIAFLGSLIQWLLSNPIVSLSNFGNWLVAVLFMLGVTFAIASFVFILLTLNVRAYERLCDPIKLVSRMLVTQIEEELLSEIISNYLVATDRNLKANAGKATVLSRAYYSYFTSTAFFLSTAIVIIFILKLGELI